MVLLKMLWVSQFIFWMGKINYGCKFDNVIMEGSLFLLSRVIVPKFTAGVMKNHNESDYEWSLCCPRFVPAGP